MNVLCFINSLCPGVFFLLCSMIMLEKVLIAVYSIISLLIIVVVAFVYWLKVICTNTLEKKVIAVYFAFIYIARLRFLEVMLEV